MKKIFLLLAILLSVSVFPISNNENELSKFNNLLVENQEEKPPCYAYITRQEYNLMTQSFQSVTRLEYLGEVNEGSTWGNQMLCDFRASVRQAIIASPN